MEESAVALSVLGKIVFSVKLLSICTLCLVISEISSGVSVVDSFPFVRLGGILGKSEN